MNLNANSGQDFPEWPADQWVDPLEERAKLRIRLQRFRIGFGLIGLSLALLSLHTIGELLLAFRRGPGLAGQLGIPHFELITGAIISLGALLGTLMICGPWPDANWQKRSGILLMFNLTDAIIWTMDNASVLGLYDGKIGHEWFLNSLTRVMAWSEFALTVSLAADIASQLGQPKATEMSRSARSLTTTGAMVWFMFFISFTDWSTPIWPLRRVPFLNPGTLMLYLSWHVLFVIVLVQVTIMSLLAARCCVNRLREMALADRANDMMPSRSEDGWEDMIRKSGPQGGP